MSEEATPAPDEGQAPPSGEVAPSWTEGFSDEMRGYIETKGFSDPAALATSYQNLEKLRGVPEERLVQLPADMSDLEAMAPVYSKMGRPETADAYTNVLGEGFDTDTFKAITERAHMLGMGDGQLQGMQEAISEIATKTQEAQDAEADEQFSAWKESNEDGYQNAARVMAAVGLKEGDIAALLNGDKTAIYDFAAKVGARSAEGDVVHGQQPTGDTGFGMSKAVAQSKISELFQDKAFTDAYYSTNKAIRQPAINRMIELQKTASGEGT